MQKTLLMLAVIVLAGVAFRRLRPGGVEPDAARAAIISAVLNVFLPAIALKTLYEADFGLEMALVPLTSAATLLTMMAVSVVLYGIIGSKLGLSRPEQGALVLTGTFGNVLFMGLPVLGGIYGEEGVRYALYYDLMASTPIVWLVGAPLAAWYGGKRFGLGGAAKIVIKLPPLWGVAIGAFLNIAGVGLPEFLLGALEMMGALVSPLMIFCVGLALTLPGGGQASALAPALAVKLALSPLFAYYFARTVGLRGNALEACALEGAMPTALITIVIAGWFGLSESLTALMIVVTTALGFFLLPGVYQLVQ